MSAFTAITADDLHDGLVLPRRSAHRAPAHSSRRRLWTGRVLSGLVVAFLLFDSTIKLLRVPAVLEASKQLGFSEGSIFAIGLILLGCTILYLVPRLSLVGALLITGYLGGAVATHVRLGNPLFS